MLRDRAGEGVGVGVTEGDAVELGLGVGDGLGMTAAICQAGLSSRAELFVRRTGLDPLTFMT